MDEDSLEGSAAPAALAPAVFAPVEIRYDEALMRRVVNHWWLRTAAGWTLALASFALAATVYALVLGDRSWVVGVFGTLSVVVIGLAFALRRAHLRQAVERVQQLDGGRATLSIAADGVTFAVRGGTAHVAWRDVRELRMHDDYWLLMRAPNDWSTLPIATIPPPARAYIVEHFAEAGARVREIR